MEPSPPFAQFSHARGSYGLQLQTVRNYAVDFHPVVQAKSIPLKAAIPELAPKCLKAQF